MEVEPPKSTSTDRGLPWDEHLLRDLLELLDPNGTKRLPAPRRTGFRGPSPKNFKQALGRVRRDVYRGLDTIERWSRVPRPGRSKKSKRKRNPELPMQVSSAPDSLQFAFRPRHQLTKRGYLFCDVLDPSCYHDDLAAITTHPVMLSTVLSYAASSFLEYKILHSRLMWLPTSGTTQVGTIYLAHRPVGAPVKGTFDPTILTSSDGAVVNSVCSSATTIMGPQPWHPMIVKETDGISPNYFVYTDQNSLSAIGVLFIEIEYAFRGGNNGTAFTRFAPRSRTFVSSVNGMQVQGGTCPDPTMWIVQSSTVDSVDCGEIIVVPPMELSNHDYPNLAVTHNGTGFNYTTGNDDGTFTGWGMSNQL